MVLAAVAKLCWKYFTVPIKTTWFPIREKFISVEFLPPILISLVHQETALIPFRKKKNQIERAYEQ